MSEAADVSTAIWSLYIIRCADESLYIGITTDVERRFADHQDGNPRSAKYVRGRGPLILVYQTEIGDRSLASRYEYACKQLSKAQKHALVMGELDIFDLDLE